MDVEGRLAALGLSLPTDLPPPAGDYEPFRLVQGFGSLSAQVPGYGRDAPVGRVGAELTLEQGRVAAGDAALNALGRIRQALDGFDRLVGLLHLAGHVASSDAFLDQPAVVDGASALLVSALGERGRHSRTAFRRTSRSSSRSRSPIGSEPRVRHPWPRAASGVCLVRFT